MQTVTYKISEVKLFSNAERTKGLRAPIAAFDYTLGHVVVNVSTSEGAEEQISEFACCLVSGASEVLILPVEAFKGADATGFEVRLGTIAKTVDVSKDATDTAKAMVKTKLESLLSTSFIVKTISSITSRMESVAPPVAPPTEQVVATDPAPAGSVAEESNPGPIGKIAGKFTDPKTGEEIVVIAKDGESPEEAMARVKKNHGL